MARFARLGHSLCMKIFFTQGIRMETHLYKEISDGTHRPEPSAHYVSAAQEVAMNLGLDVSMVVNGHPMTYGGVNFWLRHYGPADPGAMAVMFDIGDLPVDNE